MHSSRRTATCAPHSSTSPNQALAPVLSSLPAPSLARANPLPRPISPSRLPTPVRASCWWMVTCAKASFTSFSELLPNPVSAKCSQPASPVPKPFDPQKWPISGSCRAARLPTDQVNYSSTPRRENFSRRLPSNTTMFSLTPRQSWPPTTSPVWPPNWTGQSSSCVLIIRPPVLLAPRSTCSISARLKSSAWCLTPCARQPWITITTSIPSIIPPTRVPPNPSKLSFSTLSDTLSHTVCLTQ